MPKANLKLKNIKKIIFSHLKSMPDGYFTFTSNLNWLRYENQIKSIIMMFPENGKVLDVGCGAGHTTAMILSLRPDLKVVGLDRAKEVPAWRELKRYGCNFIRNNVESISLRDGEFDAVVSFGTIEHVNNINKCLEEIFRVLKRDGYNIIFNFPNKYSISELFARIFKFIFHEKVHSHEMKCRICEIEKLLTKHGFKIVDTKREFLIPAQIARISKNIGEFFNKHYKALNKLDKWVTKTPLNIFSQTLTICCKK